MFKLFEVFGKLSLKGAEVVDKALAGTEAKAREITKSLGSVSESASGVGTSFKGMASEAAIVSKKVVGSVTAIATALLGVSATTATAARDIRIFSQVGNAGVLEFQRFAAGAATVGFEQEKASDILKDFTDRVGDFVTTGAGPMVDFFEVVGPKVGVTAEAFANLSGPEALQLFVTSMERAGLSTQQMTFFMEAMAGDSTKLLPLLLENGRALQEVADAAERAGAILDESTIKAGEKFDRAMRRVGDTLRGVRNIVGAEFLPVFTDLANTVADFVVNNRDGIRDFAQRSADGLDQLVPKIAAVASGLGDVTVIIGQGLSVVAEFVGGWERLGLILGALFAGKLILAVGTFLLSLVNLGIAIGGLIKTVFSLSTAALVLVRGFAMIGPVLSIFGSAVAVLGGPITALIAGLTLLGAWLFTNRQAVGEWAVSMLDQLNRLMNRVRDWSVGVINLFTDMGSAVGRVVTNMASSIVSSISNMVNRALSSLKRLYREAVGNSIIPDLARDVVQVVGGMADDSILATERMADGMLSSMPAEAPAMARASIPIGDNRQSGTVVNLQHAIIHGDGTLRSILARSGAGVFAG